VPYLLLKAEAGAAEVDLVAGANVLSYAGFPSQYSAFQLLNQFGLGAARAVRMLDSESGRWAVAEVVAGRLATGGNGSGIDGRND